MAEFNPGIRSDSGQAKETLGYSKGVEVAKPNSTFKELFEGVSQVGDAIVGTIDKGIKTDINDQVTAGVDKIRGEVGVDLATDKASAGSTLLPNQEGTPVPGAITKAQSDVARLKEAYDQGKINDSYYWGRVNALAKQIRTQYPGYRDEIDASFSGVTGSNPANALRKAVQSDFDAAQNKLSSAQNKEDQFVNQNLNEITQTMPDFWQRKANGNPYDFDTVRANVAKKQTQNAMVKEQSSELELMDKKGKLDTDTMQSSATARANQIVNDSVAAGVQSLGTEIQNALKSGKPIPPEQIQAFKTAYGQLRAKADVSINQYLNTPFGEDKSRTPASILKDSSKIKSIKENALANLDAMQEMLVNGQYGLFQQNASIAKATTDYTYANVLRNSESARKLAAAQQIAPQAIGALVNSRPGLQLLDDFSEAILNTKTAESVIGEGSITKGLGDLKNPKSGKLGKGAATRLIDDHVQLLSSPETPPEARANLVKATFGDTEANFLEKFSGGDRLRVFQKMTSPEVTKQMVALRSTDPKAFEQYKKWATNSFNTVLKTQADTVRDAAVFSSDVNLQYDPAAMQFVIKVAEAPAAGTGLGALAIGSAQVLANNIRNNNLQAQLGPINSALKNMKPILEAEGKDPEALVKVMTGLDPKTPKQQGLLEWLGNGVLNAVSGAAKTLNPISPAKGATSANPKMDIQLADYTPEQTADAVPDSAVPDLVSLDDVGGSVTAEQRTGVKGLLDKISVGESGGSYNKIFGGKELPLTEMTLGQVMNVQSQMLAKGSPSTALGKYQFLNKTLRSVAQKMGIGPETQFTPEVQDQLAYGLLQGRGLNQYLSGKLSESAFLDNIAHEWAAVPMSNGRGAYDGDGLNKARKNTGELLAAIRSLKT